MKAASLIVFLVAGLFLGSVLGTTLPVRKCGKGMIAAGCACNGVCNQPPHACPASCTNTKNYCACLPDYVLPDPTASYCIPKKECPCKPSKVDNTPPKAKCGSGMKAAGCACNQVCNQKLLACAQSCSESPDFCACLPGYSLPKSGASYCIPAKECPAPS